MGLDGIIKMKFASKEFLFDCFHHTNTSDKQSVFSQDDRAIPTPEDRPV